MDDEDYGALISSAYPPIDFSGITGFSNYEPYLQDEIYCQLQFFVEMVIQLSFTSDPFFRL